MGDIKAFLQSPVMGDTKEVFVSKRFKDESGNPVPFVIRVIDQETNERLIHSAMRRKKINGQIVQELDNEKYGKLLVQSCVAEPDFSREEFCSHYKTMDPLEVPGRMLTIGEYSRLVYAIKEFNELVTSEDELSALEEEAKN